MVPASAFLQPSGHTFSGRQSRGSRHFHVAPLLLGRGESQTNHYEYRALAPRALLFGPCACDGRAERRRSLVRVARPSGWDLANPYIRERMNARTLGIWVVPSGTGRSRKAIKPWGGARAECVCVRVCHRGYPRPLLLCFVSFSVSSVRHLVGGPSHPHTHAPASLRHAPRPGATRPASRCVRAAGDPLLPLPPCNGRLADKLSSKSERPRPSRRR